MHLNYLKGRNLWIPAICLAIVSILHFWFLVLHPSTMLYGGPGDHTAGIIWLYAQNPQTPWWTFTHQTSYPWGESLWSPLFILGQIGYILFWFCSKLAGGPIAGYNLFTYLGFVISFVVTYSFVYRRVFHRPLLASLLALCVSFTPMALFLNAVGHTSYIFMPAYLIGVTWLVLLVMERKKALAECVALGLFIGATVLFDPYFVLIIPLAAVSFFIYMFVAKYNEQFSLSSREILKRILVVGISALIVVLPVFIYLKLNSGAVGSVASATRGNILGDAYSYSSRIEDFLLPAAGNPIYSHWLQSVKTETFHGKDATFTLFLGYSLLCAVVVSIVWRLRHKSGEESCGLRYIGSAFFFVAFVAFLFSLPPSFDIFGAEIYTPTYLLVKLTPAWRIFARLYFVIQPALVLGVALTLSEYLGHYDNRLDKQVTFVRKWMPLAAILLCVILLFEYLPRNPFNTSIPWSYKSSLPGVYQSVAEKPGTVLAEYPLREQPYYRGSLYITGQQVHQMPMINAYSPTSETAYIRSGIMDLSNSQTLPVLKYLGANTVIVWSRPQDNWATTHDGLNSVKSDAYSNKFESKQVVSIYRIADDIEETRYEAVIPNGYQPKDEGKLTQFETPLYINDMIASIDLCQVTHRQSCPEPTGILYFNGEFINHTGKPVELTLRPYDNNGEVQHKILQPGTSSVTIEMSSEKYVVSYDGGANEQIFVRNQHISNNSNKE